MQIQGSCGVLSVAWGFETMWGIILPVIYSAHLSRLLFAELYPYNGFLAMSQKGRYNKPLDKIAVEQRVTEQWEMQLGIGA